MPTPVVTRFAPSPTGYLHIGGARTALFCWLYAKHTNGKFLLRIEDTDRARSTEDATRAILDGLSWLGLEWDGQTVFQSQRSARHVEIAQQILARGQAYRCYLSPAELEAMRGDAGTRKDAVAVRSPWRDRDPSAAPAGVKPVIRLKVPRDGETIVDDKVQGRVVVQNKDIDDLIILRSDGTPIYNLAVVVDDHDMGVTHVIRGVDHLTNAAKQTLIYKAMGWDVPVFAHVPLIHGADGAKLSKRHGAQGVEEFRAMGYLPAALRNYLVRLGWSHGDDEIFSTEQMIEWFDIEDLGRSPARFDFAKLADVNGHTIRKSQPVEIRKRLEEALPEMAGGAAIKAGFDRVGWNKLDAILPALMERAKTLRDIPAGAGFLLAQRPLEIDDKAAKVLDGAARATLAELVAEFSGAGAWEAAGLETIVRAYVERTAKKLGQVAQPLRAALTGSTVSPPVFEVMVALGREEALGRLRDVAG